MLDNTPFLGAKHRWFRIGDSLINLAGVIRIYRNDKSVTFEYGDDQVASYDYDTDEMSMATIDQLFEFLST